MSLTFRVTYLTLYALTSSSYVPHAPPTSSSSISLPQSFQIIRKFKKKIHTLVSTQNLPNADQQPTHAMLEFLLKQEKQELPLLWDV